MLQRVFVFVARARCRLTEKDILEAVRVHMTHEDGISPRFTLSQERGTGWIIKVQPKRDHREPRDHQDRPHPRRSRGSNDTRPADTKPAGGDEGAARSLTTNDKLEMSLDELAKRQSGASETSSTRSSSPRQDRGSIAEKAQRINRKIDQMGLRKDGPEQFKRRPPGMPRGGKEAASEDLSALPSRPMPRRKKPAQVDAPTTEMEASTEMEVDDEVGLEDMFEDNFDKVNAEAGQKPSPPPGEHWTQYAHADEEGLSWWYYDGPRGRWMAECEGGDPQPYDDDE